MYDSLAAVYDKLIGFDYGGYMRYISPLLHGDGLDLACGSGNMTRLLTQEGHKMTGADISSAMLSLAAERCEATWVQGDISKIKFPDNAYGFVTCVCDGFNYLSPRALARTINHIYGCLERGGVLIFDVSTPYKLNTLMAGNDFFYEEGGIYLGWNNYGGGGKCDVYLTLFTPKGDGYEKSEEFHRLYVHERKFLLSLLKGFVVRVADGEKYGKVHPRSKRWMFICEKV